MSTTWYTISKQNRFPVEVEVAFYDEKHVWLGCDNVYGLKKELRKSASKLWFPTLMEASMSDTWYMISQHKSLQGTYPEEVEVAFYDEKYVWIHSEGEYGLKRKLRKSASALYFMTFTEASLSLRANMEREIDAMELCITEKQKHIEELKAEDRRRDNLMV